MYTFSLARKNYTRLYYIEIEGVNAGNNREKTHNDCDDTRDTHTLAIVFWYSYYNARGIWKLRYQSFFSHCLNQDCESDMVHDAASI